MTVLATAEPPLTDLPSVWPNLDNAKLDSLRTLRAQKPSTVPMEKVISLWARALSVPAEQVEAWLNYNPDEADDVS